LYFVEHEVAVDREDGEVHGRGKLGDVVEAPRSVDVAVLRIDGKDIAGEATAL
jgi:hypothetical protein